MGFRPDRTYFPTGSPRAERVLSELDHDEWMCEKCGALVSHVTLREGDGPVLFGTCRCRGWTAKDYPALAGMIRTLVREGFQVHVVAEAQDEPEQVPA